jgi:hypothetical protein
MTYRNELFHFASGFNWLCRCTLPLCSINSNNSHLHADTTRVIKDEVLLTVGCPIFRHSLAIYGQLSLPSATHWQSMDNSHSLNYSHCKHFDEPQCAEVCPVDCCLSDPDNVETEEELLAKLK